MTKDEALKMAIEALEMHVPHYIKDRGCEAIQACKEALEQTSQEPVAKYVTIDGLKYPAMVEVMAIHDDNGVQTEDNCDCINAFLPQGTKLYTHPAPSWQGLSDDEIETIMIGKNGTYFNFARAIEQALKEKNNAV